MPLFALVVDDSMLIRHTVCRFLEERGFTVEAANNGLEAMQAISSLRPDIIITDIRMPEMNGSELITALKSQNQTSSIPVIVVASKQSSVDGIEGRADYVIFKDIEIETQLGKALDKLLGDSGASGPRAHAATT